MTDTTQRDRVIGMLPELGFVRVSGADATGFLQSMLSADVAALEVEASMLAGWHDRSGRALACPRVVRKNDGFWLVLPRELVAGLVTGLGRFVLRSKVELTDASDELAAAGVFTETGRYEVYAPATTLGQRVATHIEQGSAGLQPGQWELADIRDGLPAVYAATSGKFTAQMLNLDLVDGVSFNKGCYPGQEVIARTHHLGRAKRRMQRFVAAGPLGAPGDALNDRDGRRAAQLLRVAPTAGGSEALAVAALEKPPLLFSADGVEAEAARLPYSIG